MARTGTRVEVSADLRRLLSLSPTPEVRALVPSDGSPFLVQSTPASSARLRALALIARRLREIRTAKDSAPTRAGVDEVAASCTAPTTAVESRPVSGGAAQSGSTFECEITPQEPSDGDSVPVPGNSSATS